MWYNLYIVLLVVFVMGVVLASTAWYYWLRKLYIKKLSAEMHWEELAGGTSGDINLEIAWLQKAQEIYELFCVKQHDYGPTNIAVGGLKGLTFRMGDKVSRLWNLSGLVSGKENKKANNESTRDSWLDLADYGIIGAMVLDGNWPTARPEQVWGREALEEILRQEGV
jgi:hypothetical protein